MGERINMLVRSVDREKRTVTAMVSTNEIDSYGSIILPSAFAANMQRYLANPVLLDNHNLRSDPVGRCVDWAIVADGLQMTFEFAPTPSGDTKLALYEGGFLRGFSVGGDILDAVWAWDKDERKAQIPSYARALMDAGKCDFVITQLELWEVSCATVPANPGAVTRAVMDGSLQPEVAQGLLMGRAYGAYGRTVITRIAEDTKPEPEPEPEPEVFEVVVAPEPEPTPAPELESRHVDHIYSAISRAICEAILDR